MKYGQLPQINILKEHSHHVLPVSYTHLDVYKRQDPDIIGNRINYERISALQLQDERFQGFDFGKELSLSLIHI